MLTSQVPKACPTIPPRTSLTTSGPRCEDLSTLKGGIYDQQEALSRWERARS